MKRFSAVLFISIFIAFSITAFDNDTLLIRITPRVGLLNGTINEYVFDDENCKNTDHKVSQLDWDVKNIPVLGLKAEVDFLRYIAISFDGSVGISKESGYMQDYDWRNSLAGIYKGVPRTWIGDDATELTDYSKHTNVLEKYMDLYISAGGNIYLPFNLKLTPFISYQYEFIHFAGKYGFGVYKQYDKSSAITDYSSNNQVISYLQETNAMFLGLSVKFDNIPHTNLSADFLVSPKMTFLNALDYHYTRYFVCWDKHVNLWQLKGNIEADFKFNRHNKAGLSSSIQYIPVSRADTRAKDLLADGTIEPGLWSAPSINGGGTSRLIWNISLNYSFSL